MKNLYLLFILLSVSPSLAIAEGGNSSGGGGYNVQDTNRPQYGIGPLSLVFRQPESDEQKKLTELVQKKQASATTCPGSPLQIAQIPKSIGQYFAVRSEGNTAITNENLCADEALLQSYTSFALAAIQLENREKNDGIGKDLVLRTGSKPIPITIHRKRLVHKANGGDIEESTWFNKEDGIHWASKQACAGGINCHMFARTEGSLLTHELILLLLQRKLGRKYPDNQIWHDVRFVKKSNSDMGSDRENISKKLYLSKTSEGAAFVEGLANAFEARHFLEENPFLERDKSLSGVNAQSCYFNLNETARKTRFTKTPFFAPRESEVYVGSAIIQLFSGLQPSREALSGDPEIGKNLKGYLTKTVNIARMNLLLQAIDKYAPTNVEELAQAIDKTDGGDLGRRWLREFFFYDYDSKEKIGAGFTTKKDEDRVSYTCSADPDYYRKSFSYIRAQEEAKALILAKALHARNLSPAELEKDIQNTLARANRLRTAALKKISLDQFESVCAKLVQRGLCERAGNEKSFSAFLDNMFDVLQKSNRGVADDDFSGIFRRICGTLTPEETQKYDMQSLVARLDEAEKKAEYLKGQKPEKASSEYFAKIQTWIEAKTEIEDAAKRLDETVAVYSASIKMLNPK